MLKDEKPPLGIEVMVYKYQWGPLAYQIGILQNITEKSFGKMNQEDVWFFRGRSTNNNGEHPHWIYGDEYHVIGLMEAIKHLALEKIFNDD